MDPAWDEIPWDYGTFFFKNSLLVIGLGFCYPFVLNEGKEVVFAITQANLICLAWNLKGASTCLTRKA